MADVQIAVIDQQNTQIALAAPAETQVTAAVPGVQGPVGEGVPQGGSANQVLFKQSGTDYDTAWGEITSEMIGDLEIVDADVATAAAIAGTKISPNFGSQNVITTGTSTAASFTPTSSTVPTNGVYLPAANSVALSTNGAGRLFVDASGNVKLESGGLRLRGDGNSISADQASATYLRFNVDSVNALDIQRISTSGAQLRVTQFSTGASAAGYPAFTNSADPNTGVFFPDSSDTFGIATGGTERLRVTSAGLVGIGTSDPASGTSSYYDDLVVRNATSGTGAGITIQSNSTNGFSGLNLRKADGTDVAKFVSESSSGKLYIETAGSTAITVDTSQRVGIGTTSPTSLLHLSASALADLRFTDPGEATDQKNWSWQTGTGIGAGTFRLRAINDANSTGENAYIITRSGASVQTHQWLTAGSERARIDSSGRVGIGTSSPDHNLDLIGTTTSAFRIRSNASATRGFELWNDSDTDKAYISNYYVGSLIFQTNNTPCAEIDGSGRLLVGTSSDSGGALFQVNGDRIRVATAKTPASATDTGTTGEICWDADYLYVCTATNTWKRAALSTW